MPSAEGTNLREPTPEDAPLPHERLDALGDLRTPWCLRVAVSLRIAERLASGTADSASLAAATGCDAAALDAVLCHLAAEGVFDDDGHGGFGLNELSRALMTPGSHLGLGLDGIGGRMAAAWATLPAYVRTGQSAYRQLNGLQFWEDLAANPDVAASFDDLMGIAGHGTPSPPPITGGWETVTRVVDVGGGTGAMLVALLTGYPHLTGTLVDLPGTVARSAEVFAAAGLTGRVTGAGQSFFDPLPFGADVYFLGKVLNDWAEAETVAILRRCAEAAAPRGRVLVAGGVVPDGTRPGIAIDMVVAGGSSSTLSRFRELAAEAGLAVVAVHQRPGAGLVVECGAATSGPGAPASGPPAGA